MVLLKCNVNKNSVVTYSGTLRLLLLQPNLQDPIGYLLLKLTQTVCEPSEVAFLFDV
jgi:hypothetical protein